MSISFPRTSYNINDDSVPHGRSYVSYTFPVPTGACDDVAFTLSTVAGINVMRSSEGVLIRTRRAPRGTHTFTLTATCPHGTATTSLTLTI